MFTTLGNIIVLFLLIGLFVPATCALEFFYPFSNRLAEFFSNKIVQFGAPGIFKILKCYKKFRLSFFDDNKENLPEQFIIISNHQSLLDIPIYMTFFSGREVRFVAKDSLSKNIPMVSSMLKSQGHCFIPRRGGASIVMRRIDSFAERCLKNKWNPVIFPEGTRSRDGKLGTLYSAGFRRIADSTKLPVVVCVLDEGYKINDVRHIMENMNKVNYHAKILKIYPPALTKEEQVAILNESKELMERQLAEWRCS